MLEKNKMLISDVTLWFYIPPLVAPFVVRGTKLQKATQKMFCGSANSKKNEETQN